MGLACQDRREHIADARDQHRNLEPGEAARCHEGPAHLPKLLARKQHGQWDHVFAKWILPRVQLDGVQTSVSEDHANAITLYLSPSLSLSLFSIYIYISSLSLEDGHPLCPTHPTQIPDHRVQLHFASQQGTSMSGGTPNVCPIWNFSKMTPIAGNFDSRVRYSKRVVAGSRHCRLRSLELRDSQAYDIDLWDVARATPQL